jgi:rhodanese-related sulfurtransferase
MRRKPIIITSILIVLLITGFYLFPPKSNDVISVQSDEFSKLINEGIFTLQVHTPYYREINGTDLIIEDWKNIENYLGELPPKDTPIAVYCRSGSMSEVVSKQLVDLGYEVVYDLENGMNAWEESGRELIIK